MLGAVLLVLAQVAGDAADDHAPGVVLVELVDLERDVRIHLDAQQLAALGGAEQQRLVVDGVVDRGQVHLVAEVERFR